MKNKNIWSVKFNTASLVLIPIAVGINYVGKLFAGSLNLPLWLDSIGTMLAAFLSGPIIGALCGALNNIIYGFQSPISFIYALTSIGIGLAAGILARKGFFTTFAKALLAGLIIALVAICISTPLNIIFWGGQTGNVFGDAVFAISTANGFNIGIASLLDEIVVDLPDKIITVIIVFAIIKALPKKLISIFNSSDEIESLDSN